MLLLPWALVSVQDCRILFFLQLKEVGCKNYRVCVSVQEVIGHRKVMTHNITAC